jgi:protein O-mannosyl-transferase
VQLYRFLTLILSRYSVWLPFAATLLFALHPIHSEVVANIKSRDEILCLLFLLLTANELLQKQKATIAGAIYFALCLLSKEAGILYAPVLVVLLMLFGRMDLRQATKTLVPIGIVTILWLGWHYTVIHTLSSPEIIYTRADNSLIACPDMASRLGTGFVILGMYMAKSIWPYNMSYDYSFNQIPCENGFSFAAISVLAIGIGLLYVAYRYFRKAPPLAFGIIYFFCTILFASNIVYLIGSTMGDRLLFSPVLGTIICLTWGLYKLTGQLAAQKLLNTASIGIIVIALAFCAKTLARNADWKSNDALFAADMSNAPGSARVQYNYGTSLLNLNSTPASPNNEGLADAVQLFTTAVTIDTTYRDAFVNLGVAQYKLAHYQDAFIATLKALQLNPQDSTVMTTIGDCFFMTRQYDQAVNAYRGCLRRGELKTRTFSFLGTTLFSQQKYAEAIDVFKQGVAFDSTNAELWGNYGNALGASNRLDEAANAFNKSLQINPNQKNILYFLSITYRNKGDIAKADEYLRLSQAK